MIKKENKGMIDEKEKNNCKCDKEARKEEGKERSQEKKKEGSIKGKMLEINENKRRKEVNKIWKTGRKREVKGKRRER